MISNTLLTSIFLLAAVFILIPTHIEAKCNSCTEYGIACVNETSFNLCFGDKIDTSNVFNCPENKICSATSLRCVDISTGGKPACESNKRCGNCEQDKLFACTSRTTFAQCNGDKLSEINGVCPEGLVCDSESGEICKDECNRPEILECDRESPL